MSRLQHILTTAAAFACMLLLPAYAVGATGDLSDRAVERFEQHVVQAAEARADGDYETAIEHFEAAIEIADRPRLRLEVADAYAALDDCHGVEATLEALLDEHDADESLEESVQRRLDAIGPCPSDGRLAVECSPSDAEITVRLIKEGETKKEDYCPTRWTVAEGDYTVSATGDGLSTEEREISVVVDETQRTSLSLIATDDPSDTDDDPSTTHWSTYASYGALGLGATLVTTAFISDQNTDHRLQNLQAARDAGDDRAIEEWTAHNDGVRQRNFILYASGAALLVGGGAGLAWNLMGDPDSSQDQWSLNLEATPTEVRLRAQW